LGEYRHRISFCADHDTADLSSLPAQLGMSANRLWKVGESRVAPNGRAQVGDYQYSYCSIEFESSSQGLPKSLKLAVEKLRTHKAFLEELSASGVKLRFFIGWFSDFNSADRFEWELLRDIADLKISLDFDFYGPDETEQTAP
jgi:hypothetical protein